MECCSYLVVLDESELLLLGDAVLPEAPVLELEPDLLKYASHSERETCPSLFASADEKFGAELLLLEDVPPADDVSEEVLEDGVLLEDDEGVLDDDEDCATASVDRAKSAAAVMMLRDLGMDSASSGLNRVTPVEVQALCPSQFPRPQ